jgi:hypothetical protein
LVCLVADIQNLLGDGFSYLQISANIYQLVLHAETSTSLPAGTKKKAVTHAAVVSEFLDFVMAPSITLIACPWLTVSPDSVVCGAAPEVRALQ